MRNVRLGSLREVISREYLQKAGEMKAEALGIISAPNCRMMCMIFGSLIVMRHYRVFFWYVQPAGIYLSSILPSVGLKITSPTLPFHTIWNKFTTIARYRNIGIGEI